MNVIVRFANDLVDEEGHPGRTGADGQADGRADGLSGTRLMKHWGVTMRALRFYESRGLISPRREGRTRVYGQRDSDRIGLILQAKKYGFTLAEIARLIDNGGGATCDGLQLTAQKCRQQIGFLESQLKDTIEALADLRRIHVELCRKAGSAADKAVAMDRMQQSARFDDRACDAG